MRQLLRGIQCATDRRRRQPVPGRCRAGARSARPPAARPGRLPRVRRHVAERLSRRGGRSGARQFSRRAALRSGSARYRDASRAARPRRLRSLQAERRPGEMRLRQMVEIDAGRIAFSSLSFDVQAIVQQLVSVDVPALFKRLEKVRDLDTRGSPPCRRRHADASRRARSSRRRARRGAADRQAVFRQVGSGRRGRCSRSRGPVLRPGPYRSMLTADVRPRGWRAHRRSPR